MTTTSESRRDATECRIQENIKRGNVRMRENLQNKFLLSRIIRKCYSTQQVADTKHKVG